MSGPSVSKRRNSLTLLGLLTIVPLIGGGAPPGRDFGVLFAVESLALSLSQAVLKRPPGSVEDLTRLARADMAAVDALIRARMESPVAVIPALADHLIAAGGKRLRPLLTVAAARLARGGKPVGEATHKLAGAVEFIHTATLLHDDVVDSSRLRRGKVAAHLIWGAPSSVLVGDFLFARAFELMVETDSMRALQILAKASRVIAEGEVLQLTRAHDLGLSQELYLEIITAKTAELFAAAAEAGGVAAGASPERVEALRLYGLNLGLAFQLADDVLDYAGSSETLGKNTGDDFREGKATLPLLLAAARAGPADRGFWECAVGASERTEADFHRARELVAGAGALSDTLDLAADYAEAAKGALGAFPPGEWRGALDALADFAVSRAA